MSNRDRETKGDPGTASVQFLSMVKYTNIGRSMREPRNLANHILQPPK